MLKKRILFIDDEYLLREVIYELLSDVGYEVIAEESGADAISVFSDTPEDFDLVLTDLIMLNMMGDEIARRIRAIRTDIPIIVMTGPPKLPTRQGESGWCLQCVAQTTYESGAG